MQVFYTYACFSIEFFQKIFFLYFAFILLSVCPLQGSHCVKSIRIWRFSCPYLPTFELNTEILCANFDKSPYSLRMQLNKDQKHSEFEHFYLQYPKL